MGKNEMFSEKLQQIQAAGLYRRMRSMQSQQSAHVMIAGEDYLMMSSNSYLGLCSDERLKQAAQEAIEKFGTGSGGSRLTTGSYELHKQLEEEIAAFKGTEAALIFNTGYMANLGIISTIADKNWVIFSDRLNHASIIDGCRLSGAEIVVYEHGDMEDLEQKVEKYRGKRGLLVSDGLFSVDGDIAPVPGLVDIARRYDMLLMVDDAHATGVFGKNGGGTADYFDLPEGVDIMVGTFSKALASEGGFVAGSRDLVDYLVNRARSFIFSTALSPASIAVSLAALKIVQTEPQARETLLTNARWLRQELCQAGFQTWNYPTQIISVFVGKPEVAVAFSERLMERRIFISAIRPPTVPEGTSRLRINVMATHTKEDLKHAAASIVDAGRKLGVIGL